VALPNQQHRVHPQVWPTCAHTYIFFYSSDNRIHKLGINSPSTTIVWLVIQYDSDLTRYDTTPTTSSVDPSLARSEPSPHQYPSLSSSLEGLIKIQKQCFISIIFSTGLTYRRRYDARSVCVSCDTKASKLNCFWVTLPTANFDAEYPTKPWVPKERGLRSTKRPHSLCTSGDTSICDHLGWVMLYPSIRLGLPSKRHRRWGAYFPIVFGRRGLYTAVLWSLSRKKSQIQDLSKKGVPGRFCNSLQ